MLYAVVKKYRFLTDFNITCTLTEITATAHV